jgi:hypothetical protein
MSSIFSSCIEGLERMGQKKNIDPFLFVSLQRVFFEEAIQQLEKNNTPDRKQGILKQLEQMEKARGKILNLLIESTPSMTEFQIEALDHQMQLCLQSYNRIIQLLKTKKRINKKRLYV